MIFTPGYVAPEILRRLAANPQDSNLPYTNAVDIWSLGVIVHEILTGRLPVHDTAKKLDLRRLAAMEAPTSAIQFVESALEKDPRCRPTARELVVHEWINREGGGGESVEFLGWLDQFVKGNGVPREEETGISQDVVETWYPPEEGYPEVRRTTF